MNAQFQEVVKLTRSGSPMVPDTRFANVGYCSFEECHGTLYSVPRLLVVLLFRAVPTPY